MATRTRLLTGSRALVTGATGGLGQAQVAALSDAGATVFAHGRARDARLGLLESIPSVSGIVADLSTPAGCRGLVREAARTDGLDVLVANHATMSMSLMSNANEAEWWRVVETNLLGTFALIQEATLVMRETGRGGRIVVIVSEWGVTGWPEATAYAASKAGLISLVKSLGHELAPEGIFVNAIAPGVIDTPQLSVDAEAAGLTLEEMHREYSAGIPVGRIGQPEEIAEAVRFLCDPALTAMAGQTIQINGGATRGRV
ncbi:SDR family NAD(P)-dependent oxidoreductase [Leucobacter aridicollis]|uniref:SDR family NAD(P)-dependent oxidoreductase n=1 Tax=Leucobacter aridicollis TaxID=283878 RepID=UPI002106081C|nr:SDR family NAD(P)-dependent oxidoreductase [Leucobacter aridicollis]UTX53984.1 SDR family oxidoreductase [Leucobacter aridicollis]